MTTTSVFRGKTLADAKSAAMRSMGRDAVIVATREIAATGAGALRTPREYEVAVAHAQPIDAVSPHAVDADKRPSKPAPFAPGAYKSEPPADDGASQIAALRSEIRALRAGMPQRDLAAEAALERQVSELRGLLETLVLEQATSGVERRPERRVASLLAQVGIEGPAAARLAERLAGKPAAGLRDALREAVADEVKVTAWPPAAEQRTVVAVVGPTGVGKTTTLAKLAARAIIDEGRSVTFVACDTYRVGAVEQLSRYAVLLGARVSVATNGGDLRRIVSSARTDLVLVDTSGRGPMDPSDVEHALGARADRAIELPLRVLLCLPASVRAADAAKFGKQWAKAGPTELAMTKLDECAFASGVLHASAATGLPISTLCAGPGVPEDISQATVGAIQDALVRIERRRGRA